MNICTDDLCQPQEITRNPMHYNHIIKLEWTHDKKKQNHSSKVMAQNKTSAFKITLHNAYNAKCNISHAA